MRQALSIALEPGRRGARSGRAYANAYTFFAAQYRFAEGERCWRDGVAFCDERDISTYAHLPARTPGDRTARPRPVGRGGALAERVLATEASPVNLLTSQVTLALVLARRGQPGALEVLDPGVAEADNLAEAEWIARDPAGPRRGPLARRATTPVRWPTWRWSGRRSPRWSTCSTPS